MRLLATLLAAACVLPAFAQAVRTDAYRVDCSVADALCRVDTATYVGWRVFERHCASCHGEGAVGSSFAPELAPRIGIMTAQDFRAALTEGYRGLRMTPRAENRDVGRYIAELWSYLRARAGGGLPPGPVQQLDR